MKFLVDQPLGGLAKWLRFCGFDATLLRLAPDKPGSWPPLRPQTHILTRQAACQRLKRPDLLVLAAPEPEGQLTEVIRRLHLSPRHFKPLTRCRHCNDPLAPLEPGPGPGSGSRACLPHPPSGSTNAPAATGSTGPAATSGESPGPCGTNWSTWGTGAPTRRNNAGSFPALLRLHRPLPRPILI